MKKCTSSTDKSRNHCIQILHSYLCLLDYTSHEVDNIKLIQERAQTEYEPNVMEETPLNLACVSVSQWEARRTAG